MAGGRVSAGAGRWGRRGHGYNTTTHDGLCTWRDLIPRRRRRSRSPFHVDPPRTARAHAPIVPPLTGPPRSASCSQQTAFPARPASLLRSCRLRATLSAFWQSSVVGRVAGPVSLGAGQPGEAVRAPPLPLPARRASSRSALGRAASTRGPGDAGAQLRVSPDPIVLPAHGPNM